MMRVYASLIIAAFTFVFIGCSKNEINYTGSESELYGTWVMGSGLGDTLQFMKKNNQNVMRKAESFNPVMPVYSEKEYRFKNGKLSVKTFSPVSSNFYSIDSFTWTQPGSEFKILSTQLFLYTSYLAYYTYRKL